MNAEHQLALVYSWGTQWSSDFLQWSAEMAPATHSVTKFISSGKRCFKVLKSLSNLRRRLVAAVLRDNDSAVTPSNRPSQLSRCPFHLSIASLERHYDSHSIDTVMTWLDDLTISQESSDNRLNEKLENTRNNSIDVDSIIWTESSANVKITL